MVALTLSTSSSLSCPVAESRIPFQMSLYMIKEDFAKSRTAVFFPPVVLTRIVPHPLPKLEGDVM